MTDTTLPRATGAGREMESRTNFAVYGESGSRKTTTCEEVFLKNKKRLLICDPLRKDYGNPKVCEVLKIQYDAVLHSANDVIRHLAKKADSGDFRIVARLPREEYTRLFKLFVFDENEQRALISNCTLHVEEIGLFMDSNNIPPELEDIIVRGRHSQISFVGVAQVPQVQTNPLYRSQLHFIVSFRQTSKNAIKFFSDYTDEADRLRELEVGEYMLVHGDKKEFLEFIGKP